MARLWGNLYDELERLSQIGERRRAADRLTADITPAQIEQMASISKWYPWMPAGVTYSLARAGLTAMNPMMERVALQALQARERSAIGLGQKGDLVGPNDKLSPEQQKAMNWIGKKGGGFGFGPKSLPGGGVAGNVVDKLRDNPVTNAIQTHAFGENPAARGLKAFSRTAGAIGDLPRQLAQGTYRSVSGEIQEEGFAGALRNELKATPGRIASGGFGAQHSINAGLQTEIGAAAMDVRETGKLNVGSGFFVGGSVKERQHTNEQAFGVIINPDGSRHARTIGRDLAGQFFEPGSDAYTALSGGADFIVAIGADQATFGGAAATRRGAKAFKTPAAGPKAIKAAEEGRSMTVLENVIDAMGGIAAPGKRMTVDPNQVRNFLASNTGNALVDKAIETTSIRTLDRLTGGKLDPASLLAIADETDPDLMRAHLERLFTTGRVKGVPTTPLSRLGFTMREGAPEWSRRLNARLPHLGKEARHVANPRDSMTQFTREMDYLDLDEATQDGWLRKLADAPDIGIQDPHLANIAAGTHRRAIFDEFDNFMQDRMLREAGADDKAVAKVRKWMQREQDRLAAETNYNVLNGQPRSFFGLKTIDGEIQQPDIPTAMDLNELERHYMSAPDWRTAKLHIGKLSKYYANGIEPPLSAMRAVQDAWKGLVIARPALLARVMGEIQIAMTLRGASTWFTHPLEMISYVMGDSEAPAMLQRMLRKRGDSDIRGFAWGGHEDDTGEWLKMQDRWEDTIGTSTFYRDPGDTFVFEHYPIASKAVDGDDFYIGMADEFHSIAKGPFGAMVVNGLLQGQSVDEMAGFAWNNMGDHRKIFANAFKERDGAKILTVDGTREYIQEVTDRVMQATGNGDPELLNALKTGSLRGTPFDIKGVRNDELNNTLRQFADKLPDKMKVPRELHSGHRKRLLPILSDLHGHALDIMFSNRERTLNRSPEFRQFYYKSAVSQAGALDPQYADTFVANLEKAGIKRNDIRTAKHYAAKPADNPLTLDELDDLAFAEATDEMQFFLEDMVDKKRWVEALSIVSPFAHVISESMTRWAKILTDPSAVAKVQRPLKNARDPELGDVLGLNQDETDSERRGLLYADAQGNERIAFPLSPKMTGVMGDPIPLHGRTQGLNMIGDFSPGVGPFASIPLAALSDQLDNPRYDAIREWIFPYGTPKGGPIMGTLKQFAPTWVRKAFTDETPRQVIDAMYYKANSGDYNVQGEGATVDEINRLFNDSKQLASMTKLANAAATFFAPTAPSPEWFITDEGGKRIPMLAVVKDLQAMRDADPRNATLNMLEKYGDNVFLMLVGKSVAVSPGVLPSTVEAEKWIRSEGKGLRGKYKNTYGFFAPQEGDFSFDAYRRLLDNGDRQLNNPEDVPFIANDMVAKARYYAFRAKLDNPSDPRSAAALRDFRMALEKAYPGYDPDGPPGGTLNKASNGELIEELQRATTDKKLAGHEAIPALKKYLDFRTKIQARAPKDRGPDWWTSSNDGRGMRAAAAQYGDALAQDNPAFAAMWEGALRREFENKLAEDDAINAEGR